MVTFYCLAKDIVQLSTRHNATATEADQWQLSILITCAEILRRRR
jgi:hypothetical protein